MWFGINFAARYDQPRHAETCDRRARRDDLNATHGAPSQQDARGATVE
jgi:hypothetical protein